LWLNEKCECCSFETLGRGEFKPTCDANPFLGEVGRKEYVEEYKVEMICENHLIKLAIQALKTSHPYEVVAFDVLKLEDVNLL
jgi:hypothetical protein